MRIHGTVLVLEEMTTDCIEIHDLIPAYCLGATDPDETKLVEAHLGACPNAAAEVADICSVRGAAIHTPVVAACRPGEQAGCSHIGRGVAGVRRPIKSVTAAKKVPHCGNGLLQRWQVRARVLYPCWQPLPWLRCWQSTCI